MLVARCCLRRAALERDERTEAARDAAKRDALRALRLKTVIRENHGAARTTRYARAIAFNERMRGRVWGQLCELRRASRLRERAMQSRE